MNEAVKRALEADRVIDITTTGRKTGEPRRTEIWFHNLDGELDITGSPSTATPPRPRDWYRNMVATPAFTFHLKQSTQANLAAVAIPVVDADERRRVFERVVPEPDRVRDIEGWVASSPLVRVELADA